ncbi:MAG: SH3 domain-containing protein [Hyphomicrobiales bacterium]|nr:SH3 domain-containing protein [Hyphomicrobiales bacterium]
MTFRLSKPVLAAISGAVAMMAASILPAQAQIPRGTCMVSDPTGTPLNVRRFPNGPIVGRVRNGQIVIVRGISRDDRGRPWALLFSSDGASIGYVFREYISCRN